jgi:ubiquinone/menaquinone biosynthesis C-methylase UbiE/aryl carrier-like protein
MTHQGSYQVGSFASNTAAEIRRLNAQVDLFWPMESEVLFRHGLRDGMRVLDCGCGPGRLLELLKRRLTALQCVGVELDPLLVEAAQMHLAECGLADCTIHQGAAEQTGLPPETFDFVILRLVLEHVPDPVAALRSLGTLLKPGGRLAVISNDFDFHLRTSPPVGELDATYAAYCASRRKDGGDPCIGRRVPHLLVEAGLKLVACEIELAHNAVVGDGPFLRAEGAGIPAQLVRSGFLDEKVLDDMTRSWRAMLSAPGHGIARPLWIAIGERHDGRTADTDSRAQGEAGSALAQSVEASADQATEQPALGTLERILVLVAGVLERAAVAPDDSLAALGIDSISAMLLQERIKGLTGVEIPIARFFADEPVRTLVDHLDQPSASDEPKRTAPAGDADGATRWEEGEL